MWPQFFFFSLIHSLLHSIISFPMSYYNQHQQPPVGVPPPQGSSFLLFILTFFHILILIPKIFPDSKRGRQGAYEASDWIGKQSHLDRVWGWEWDWKRELGFGWERRKWGWEEERENLNILLATLFKNSVIFKKWGQRVRIRVKDGIRIWKRRSKFGFWKMYCTKN